MSRTARIVVPLVLLAGGLAMPAAAVCPADSVRVGRVCVDKYEASVWRIVNTPTLIAAVQAGSITSAATLTVGGAGRRGDRIDD